MNELNVESNETDNEHFKNQVFKVNSISFQEGIKQICMQSENGPCPLIAILNILLLQDKIELDEDIDFITGNQMVNYVGEYLIRVNELGNGVGVILSHFNELQTGLIVDVRFSNVTEFKDDSNLYIFEFLNIKLYHGWLMDPQNTPEYDRLRNYSYDQITELLVKDNEDANELCPMTKSFLQDFVHSGQLTYHGLCKLNETMEEQELAVLFHNNHFSVIYKNSDVYSLCTDIGYISEPGVVWQVLNSTSGDNEFVNGMFEPQYNTHCNNAHTEDTDLQLVKNIVIQEDYELARAMQAEENEQELPDDTPAHSTPSSNFTAKNTKAHSPVADRNKERWCVIL